MQQDVPNRGQVEVQLAEQGRPLLLRAGHIQQFSGAHHAHQDAKTGAQVLGTHLEVLIPELYQLIDLIECLLQVGRLLGCVGFPESIKIKYASLIRIARDVVELPVD